MALIAWFQQLPPQDAFLYILFSMALGAAVTNAVVSLLHTQRTARATSRRLEPIQERILVILKDDRPLSTSVVVGHLKKDKALVLFHLHDLMKRTLVEQFPAGSWYDGEDGWRISHEGRAALVAQGCLA